MPPVDGWDEMIDLARSVGWCGNAGMGPVPLSALEIGAWCVGTGETLTHWEFTTLCEMSAAYVGGSYAPQAPWQPTVVKMALATASFSAGSINKAST